MTNISISTTSRIASIVAGIAVAGCGLYVALCHISEPDMKVAAIALAFAAGYAAYRFSDLWHRSRALAMLAAVGILCGELYGAAQTAERILASREERARVIRTDNQPQVTAKNLVTRLENELKTAIKAETDAAKTPAKVGKTKEGTQRHAKSADEANQRLKTATKEARERLANAEKALAKMEAPRVETKLAAKIGIAADALDLGLAWVVSIGLLAFTLAFLGLGHGNRPPVAKPVTVKPTRKRAVRVCGSDVAAALRNANKPLTIAELAVLLGVSHTTARRHAKSLAGKGQARVVKIGRGIAVEKLSHLSLAISR